MTQGSKSARAAVRKVTCEECYFQRNLLCALDLSGAVRHFPSPRRSAQTAAAAALRLPPGAAHARRVGLSHRAGTGRAARVALARGATFLRTFLRERRGVYWGGPTDKAPVEAVARMAAKDSIGKASAAARAAQRNQYVKRIIEDEELRGNLLAAYARRAQRLRADEQRQARDQGAVRGSQAPARARRGGGRSARRRATRSKSPPSAVAGAEGSAARCCSRSSRACSRWRSARVCARRCSTCCSGPRRSSTTARPRCRRRRRRARWAPPPPEGSRDPRHACA